MRTNKNKKQNTNFKRRIRKERSEYITPRLIKISRTLSLDQINRIKNNSSIDSKRVKSQVIVAYRRKILVIFLCIVLIVFALIFSITQLTANINIIVNNKDIQKSVEINKYETTMKNFLNSNPIYRVRYLLDKESLKNYMLLNKPEVLSIKDSGKTSFFQTTYQLNFRRPVARWQIYNNKYYVDSSGISFEENYYSEPELNIIDNSGIKLEKGEAIASNKFLKFVGRVVEEAYTNGYTVIEAVIPPETTRELDIKLKGRVVTIKLAVDRDVKNQIEDMKNSLVYLDSKLITPTQLDLRISGKAYYR